MRTEISCITIICFSSLLYACNTFKNTDLHSNNKPTLYTIKYIESENAITYTFHPSTSINNKQLNSAPVSNIKSFLTPQKIEEKREVGGNVSSIKVDNYHLPSYYLYPSEQPNLNANHTLGDKINPPTWQFNW